MKVTAFPRTEQGSGASRRLRNAGQTPGIIYGGASAPVPIKLDHNALFHALKKETFHSSILDMEIDGKVQQGGRRGGRGRAGGPGGGRAGGRRGGAGREI